MSTIRVEVKGATEIQKLLRKWMQPELDKELDAATKKAAQMFARDLRPAVRPLSRRMARAVRVRRARRDRPAWVVGSSRKVAFFWPFVIGGTRDHGPRKAPFLRWQHGGETIVARRVRGVGAHPVVEQVANRSDGRAMAEADKHMDHNT